MSKSSIYHEFEANDFLNTTVRAAPRTIVHSGTTGWSGTSGVSGSLSLYDGVRLRSDVKSSDFATSGLSVYPIDELDTYSIDKVQFISGSYPSTGSIRFLTCRTSSAPSITQIDSENWYNEHFSVVEGLFDYYSRFNSDYFTGSYDYYSLYFNQVAPYSASAAFFDGLELYELTGSTTIEAWIKPVSTGSRDRVIMSQSNNRWKMYVTGSTGHLVFKTPSGTMETSDPVETGVWQHVAATLSSGTGSLYVNFQKKATSTSISIYNDPWTILAIGAVYEVPYVSASVAPNKGFDGFIHEAKIWRTARTQAELSSSVRIVQNSSSADLLFYARLNDGPLSTAHGFAAGSGAFDYTSSNSHLSFVNIGTLLPESPSWQPNDNMTFMPPKTRVDASAGVFKVIHVPSMYYGRQIATGSVRITCDAYSSASFRRVLVDDGRGSLYVSGSLVTVGAEQRGVVWNKVGNVFYSEGIIVITNPSLLDFAAANKNAAGTGLLTVQFDGDEMVSTKVFMCRVDQASYNASNNPTYIDITGTLVGSEPMTYITAIGLYDDERKLVGVAKLAQPIRNREKDKLDIRLRYDF